MDITFSSKKAADYLKVNESTVKRWADNGTLNCIKTPGGHRKFKIEDLKQLAKMYDYKTDYLNIENELNDLKHIVRKKNFKPISRKLQKYILKGNADLAYKLLYSLYINDYSLDEIFDLVVSDCMKNIGLLWQNKSIGVQNEHIASNAILSALQMLDKVVHKKEKIKKTAVCAGLEGEFHEIGLLCVKINLEYEGWDVIYPGINLPYKSLIQLILITKPSLVCLSSSYPEKTAEFKKKIREIDTIVKKINGLMLVGGGNIKIKSLNDVTCNSVGDLKNIINKC